MTQLEYCKRCVSCMQSDNDEKVRPFCSVNGLDIGKEMSYMFCPEFKRKEDENDGGIYLSGFAEDRKE